jgi:hypothetical protein
VSGIEARVCLADVAADINPLIIPPQKMEPTHVGCYEGQD